MLFGISSKIVFVVWFISPRNITEFLFTRTRGRGTSGTTPGVQFSDRRLELSSRGWNCSGLY